MRKLPKMRIVFIAGTDKTLEIYDWSLQKGGALFVSFRQGDHEREIWYSLANIHSWELLPA